MHHTTDPSQKPGRRRPTAFTLLELLAAVTITLIMMALINQIYYSTTEAVSLGVATSEVISSSRTVNSQINEDFAQMVKPSTQTGDPAGFLVIVNCEMTSVPAIGSGGSGEVTRSGGASNPARVRADQIAFIRDATGLEQITPNADNSVSGLNTGMHARVWYGHLLRTGYNGSLAANSVLGDSNNNERNRLATNWVLGRQALILAGTTALGNYIQGAAWNHTSTTSLQAGNLPLHTGVADTSHGVLLATSDTAPTTSGGGLITNDPAFSSVPLRPGLTNAAYRTAVLAYAVCGYDDNTNRPRLRTNATPSATSNTFTALQMAQLHPYLMANVSDFVVEFAGDYQNNTDGSYGGTDGLIDVIRSGEGFPADLVGSTKWYSGFDLKTAGVTNAINSTSLFPTGAVSGPGTPSAWSGRDFVFRHNDTTNWPHLIRIRYRLHDMNGRLGGRSPDGFNSGKWFELILRVPR